MQNKRITIWIVIAMVLALGSLAAWTQIGGNGAYIVTPTLNGAGESYVLTINGGHSEMSVLPGETGSVTASVSPSTITVNNVTYDLKISVSNSAGVALSNISEQPGVTTCDVSTDGSALQGTVYFQVGYYNNKGEWKIDKTKNVNGTLTVNAFEFEITPGPNITVTDFNPKTLTATINPSSAFPNDTYPIYWEVTSGSHELVPETLGSNVCQVTPRDYNSCVVTAYIGTWKDSKHTEVKKLDNGKYSASVYFKELNYSLTLGDGSPEMLYTGETTLHANVAPTGAPIFWTVSNATITDGTTTTQETTDYDISFTINPESFAGGDITAYMAVYSTKDRKYVKDTTRYATVHVRPWEILINGGAKKLEIDSRETRTLTATVFPEGQPIIWECASGDYTLDVPEGDIYTCNFTPNSYDGGQIRAYLATRNNKGELQKTNYYASIDISPVPWSITLNDGKPGIIKQAGESGIINATVEPDGAPIVWSLSSNSGITVTDGTPLNVPTYDYKLKYTISGSNANGGDIIAYMTKNSGGSEVKDTNNYASVHINSWLLVLNNGINPMNVANGGPYTVKAYTYPEAAELEWTVSSTTNIVCSSISPDTHEFSFWAYNNGKSASPTITAKFKDDTNKSSTLTVNINQTFPDKDIWITRGAYFNIYAHSYNADVMRFKTNPKDELDSLIGWVPMHEDVGSTVDPKLVKTYVHWDEDTEEYVLDIAYAGDLPEGVSSADFHLHCVYGDEDIEDNKLFVTLLPGEYTYRDYKIEFNTPDGTYLGKTLDQYNYDLELIPEGNVSFKVTAVDRITEERVQVPANYLIWGDSNPGNVGLTVNADGTATATGITNGTSSIISVSLDTDVTSDWWGDAPSSVNINVKKYTDYKIEFGSEDGKFNNYTLEDYNYEFDMTKSSTTSFVVTAIDVSTGERVVVPAEDYNWINTDTDTVEIDSNGVITPVEFGTGSISVELINGDDWGDNSDSAEITVVPTYRDYHIEFDTPDGTYNGLTFEEYGSDAIELLNNEAVNLKVTATDCETGNIVTVDPSNYTWSSSEPDNVSVENGTVTGLVSGGSSEISVTLTNGDVWGDAPNSGLFSVVSKYSDYQIEFNTPDGKYEGKTLEEWGYNFDLLKNASTLLKVTAYDNIRGTRVDVPSEQFEWTNTDSNNVSLSSGELSATVTGLIAGTSSNVGVTLKNGDSWGENPSSTKVSVVNEDQEYIDYQIKFAGEDGTYKGKSLEEYGYDFTVPQGGGTQLIVVAIDTATGEEVIIPASDVTWTSSDSDNVSVDSNGNVTGETIGSEATISVTLNNGDVWGGSHPATTDVNVAPKYSDYKIEFDTPGGKYNDETLEESGYEFDLPTTDSVDLKVTAIDFETGERVTVPTTEYTWNNPNPDDVNVEDGTVTGLTAGTTNEISVELINGEDWGSNPSEVTVNVTAKYTDYEICFGTPDEKFNGYTLEEYGYNFDLAKDSSTVLYVKAKDAEGNEVVIPADNFVWVNSNPENASITAEGVVTGILGGTSTQISVNLLNGDVWGENSSTTTVNVLSKYKNYKLEFGSADKKYKDSTLEDYNYVFNMGTDTVQLVVTAEETGKTGRIVVPNSQLTWNTSNWNYVRVVSGYVNGKTLNKSANITVTLKNGDEWGSNPNSCLINVVPESVEILNKEEIQRTLIPVMEEEYKIIAKVTPENSVADTVEWTVSDWNMCSIHSTYEFIDGKRTPVAYVRCKKMGKFTITCSLIFNSKVKDVVEIDNTVRNVTIESLDPNHPIVEEGGKKYIDCTIDDKEIPLTAKMDVGMDDLKAYWSSASWNDCAVVYGHMGAFVTPKTVGSETAITVTEGICNTTDTVYIRVVNSDSIKILLGGEEVNDVVQIKKGQEVNFTAQSFRGTDLNGGNELVTWSTDAPWNNARIVSNQAGGCWITGKKVGGVYTLTCKSKTNPNLTKQIQFEVVK